MLHFVVFADAFEQNRVVSVEGDFGHDEFENDRRLFLKERVELFLCDIVQINRLNIGRAVISHVPLFTPVHTDPCDLIADPFALTASIETMQPIKPTITLLLAQRWFPPDLTRITMSIPHTARRVISAMPTCATAEDAVRVGAAGCVFAARGGIAETGFAPDGVVWVVGAPLPVDG